LGVIFDENGLDIKILIHTVPEKRVDHKLIYFEWPSYCKNMINGFQKSESGYESLSALSLSNLYLHMCNAINIDLVDYQMFAWEWSPFKQCRSTQIKFVVVWRSGLKRQIHYFETNTMCRVLNQMTYRAKALFILLSTKVPHSVTKEQRNNFRCRCHRPVVLCMHLSTNLLAYDYASRGN